MEVVRSCINCNLGTMCSKCRDISWMVMLRCKTLRDCHHLLEITAEQCKNYQAATSRVAAKRNSLQLNLFEEAGGEQEQAAA